MANNNTYAAVIMTVTILRVHKVYLMNADSMLHDCHSSDETN